MAVNASLYILYEVFFVSDIVQLHELDGALQVIFVWCCAR